MTNSFRCQRRQPRAFVVISHWSIQKTTEALRLFGQWRKTAMTFDELLAQITELLQRQGRVSYGALKRRFALDDDYLQDLKDELIDAQRVAIDEDGKVLMWIGEAAKADTETRRHGDAEKQQPVSPDARHQTRDPRRDTAERRQLTVMFCDLVGSTALSEQLDPEELHEVLHQYHAVCEEVIHRFGGYIARYVGDALLVYFGYPQAHEDDARRAVHAGLEIIAALQNYPSVRHEVPSPLVGEEQGEGVKETTYVVSHLQVRIGIHTGLVVISEMGGDDYRESMALGETPNIAARLQGIAEPDTVVISAATSRLTTGLFECQTLGPQTLKGVTVPLTAYRVLRESGVQSRFEVAVATGLTPLVGREEEVKLLWQRWEQTKDGQGQVILLSGEAGIGKSRLVRVLKERTAGETQAWLECRCSPYHQNSAFYPIIGLLQRVLQFSRADSPEEKLRKLKAALQVGAIHELPLRSEVVPLFASLLSLSLPERYPPLNLTPQRQKQKTLEAVLAWLLAEAERQPVAFIVEDLHWADPSTLEFLGLLIEQVPTARLLTLLAFRPEFTPPWTSRSHFTHLTLQRLPHTQVEAMVEKLMGDQALPDTVVQQIVTKTDGVPLFVEELTKTVLESQNVGARRNVPLPQIGIPATLHDALMARLDRLGTAKEIAQLGATLGREFSYELIHAVSPLAEATLQQGLRQLVEAELLYQRGLPPQVTYLFKHALIQDAAYQSLLKSTRQQYHSQIAQVLAERVPEIKEIHPELLAHHYTEAGLVAQAIPYWQKAGERAVQRSANIEAISYLTKGLELLNSLPDTPECVRQELALQVALGGPLTATKGTAAPEVEQTYTRAQELCQQVGDTPQLFPVLWGLSVFSVARAKFQTARTLGERLLRLAQHQQDPLLLLQAHFTLASPLFASGEVALAQEHLEQVIALYNRQQHRSLTSLYGYDLKVGALAISTVALWDLGYPDQALKRIQEVLTLARELAHSHSLAIALYWASWLYQCRREGQAVQERTEALIALSREQGLPSRLAWGTILRGWALAEQGQSEEGITQIRQGLAAWRATGAEFYQPYFLALLAETYRKEGQAEEGLAVLAEALAAVDKTGERWCEAELYRLKGELVLQSAVHSLQSENPNTQHPTPSTHAEAEAEACFHKAIEVARMQQAKSLELRATISLSRLWQSQGKKGEAHWMLADIYGWFTEGFDTKDLQEAKALLEELSH